MAVEIGEARESWGMNVWARAEDIANNLKNDRAPFYIVFAAKEDRSKPGTFNQGFRMYRDRPPQLIGVLVWYVDNAQGIFELVPELSIPPDVPIDPALLSTKSQDASQAIMEVGQSMGVLLS